MILRLCAFLISLAPVVAMGQDIRVISGEHQDFSRLVLMFQERVDWQFGRVEGGFEFRSDKPDFAFDLNRVYDLIPKDRITSLRDLGDGRLFLAVECNCHGDAFDLRNSEVVLDIKDGPPARAAGRFQQQLSSLDPTPEQPGVTQIFEASGNGGGSASSASVLAFETAEAPVIVTGAAIPAAPGPTAQTLVSLQQARRGLPLFVAGTSVSEEARAPTNDPEPDSHGTEAEELAEATGADRVSKSQAALLQQISRASAQGLLSPDMTTTEDLVQRAHPHPELPDDSTPDPAGSGPAHPAPDLAHAPQDHVSIQTAIDREFRTPTDSVGVALEGDDCLPDKFFAVSDWGEPPEYGAMLGVYRSGLLGEFDVANPDGVAALARYYLYLTFGVEAAAVLTTFPADLERPDIIFDLSAIMDNETSPESRALIGQLGCDGKSALWAALARPELPAGQPVATRAVVKAFSELPLHLRRHLGPRLAERFLIAGDEATAQDLRNAIARAPGDHGAAFDLLEAHIAQNRGDEGEATGRLAHLVAQDTEITAQATIELVTRRLDRGDAVPLKEIETAAALASELRGSDLGRALRKVEIRARARSSDFAVAFQVLRLSQRLHEFDRGETSGLRAEVFKELTENGKDATFLRYVIPNRDTSGFGAGLHQDLANRLLDLGFAADAERILGQAGGRQGDREGLLLARAALIEGRFDDALAGLTGLTSDAANTTRAQALVGKARFSEAAQVYENLGETGLSAEAFWRAGDWEGLARQEESALRAAGDLMLEEAIDPASTGANWSTGTGIIAANQALLMQSQETRAVLDRLLTEVAVP